MNLLLDTSILLWAIGPAERLPDSTRRDLIDPTNTVFFSAASIWEVAIKAAVGRPDFVNDAARVAQTAVEQGFTELPVSAAHAAHVQALPAIHHDPFDRLLLAHALVEPAWLITADHLLQRHGGPVRHIQPRSTT